MTFGHLWVKVVCVRHDDPSGLWTHSYNNVATDKEKHEQRLKTWKWKTKNKVMEPLGMTLGKKIMKEHGNTWLIVVEVENDPCHN